MCNNIWTDPYCGESLYIYPVKMSRHMMFSDFTLKPKDWTNENIRRERRAAKLQDCSMSYILNQQRALHFHRMMLYHSYIRQFQLHSKIPTDSS